jgi:signal transduction histidine kinase
LNLVNNAPKFTAEEEGKLTRGLRRRPARFVDDTGIGIKPEQMGMLFEAFNQLDGSARRIYEGTGLGLHLCRRLLRLMGATSPSKAISARVPGLHSSFRQRP